MRQRSYSEKQKKIYPTMCKLPRRVGDGEAEGLDQSSRRV